MTGAQTESRGAVFEVGLGENVLSLRCGEYESTVTVTHTRTCTRAHTDFPIGEFAWQSTCWLIPMLA